jgi:hypothetical protein
MEANELCFNEPFTNWCRLDLLPFFLSKKVIRWDDQLIIACLLDHERMRKEILNRGLAKTTFNKIANDQYTHAYFSDPDLLLRRRVTKLVKQGILVKSRRAS